MAASTNDIVINPGDGWTKISSGAIASFFAVRHFPCHVPIFITVSASAPAKNSTGIRSDHGKFWANGALSGQDVYVRQSNNGNGPINVSFYQN